jgi:hypothetical protein
MVKVALLQFVNWYSEAVSNVFSLDGSYRHYEAGRKICKCTYNHMQGLTWYEEL